MTGSRNEGEGNRTAARAFNDAQRRFVRDGGRWKAAAARAEKALDGAEGESLEAAAARGRDAATGKRGASRR